MINCWVDVKQQSLTHSSSIIVFFRTPRVCIYQSEWVILTNISTTIVYHSENKLLFFYMYYILYLYWTNTLSSISLVLTHWNDSRYGTQVAPFRHNIPITKPISHCSCFFNDIYIYIYIYISTKVVSSNPAHGKVYLIQHNVIKCNSDLRQFDGFLLYLSDMCCSVVFSFTLVICVKSQKQ